MLESSRARTGAIGLALGLLTLALYWPVRGYDFINYDDPFCVLANAQVLNGLRWEGLQWAFTTFHAGNWYPLTWLSHMLDCQAFGPQPGAAHLVNAGLHVANALLLFLVCKRLTGALWRSALVAALFAWHPAHVESVAWIAERKDVLSTFFFLLTLGAWAGYVSRKGAAAPPEGRKQSKVQSPKSKAQSLKAKVQRPAGGPSRPSHASLFYCLALLCFALGLMSKPMLVTLPFVLLLLDYWPCQRLELASLGSSPGKLRPLLWEKLPFFALSAAASVVTLFAQRAGAAVISLERMPLPGRLANALVAYARYVGELLWPQNLAVLYPHPDRWPVGAVVGAALLLVALSAGMLWLGRSRRYLAVGWLWFVGMLVPVIGLVQVGLQARADRYTYLPSIGFFLALVWGVGGLAEAGRWRLAARTAAALGLGLCLGLTHRQVGYWQSSETLFRHALQVTTNNYVAYNNLGLYQITHGDITEAIQNYRQAAALAPNYSDAWENLGTALGSQGLLEEALHCYEASLRASPGTAQTHSNMGALLDQLGRGQEAVTHFHQALQLDPGNPAVHCNLGRALARQGQYAEAIVHFRATLQANPDDPNTRCSLGKALAETGQLEEAIHQQQLVLQADPTHLEAHNQLGVALLRQGKPQAAADQFREILRVEPNNAQAHFQLGAALARNGELEPAATQFRRVLELAPDFAPAHYQLGLLSMRRQDPAEALGHWRQAVRVAPGWSQPLTSLAWVLATTPRTELRNGAEAVQLATQAAALAGTNDLSALNALAAACAEAGRFEDAIAAAGKAQALASAQGASPTLARQLEQRLALYRAHQPYREASPKD